MTRGSSEECVSSKALITRERAELKLRMQRIHDLSTTPRRAGIMTYNEVLALLKEIENLAGNR
jgi:hypothetical protein